MLAVLGLGAVAFCAFIMHLTKLADYRRLDVLGNREAAIGLCYGLMMTLGSYAATKILEGMSREKFLALVEALQHSGHRWDLYAIFSTPMKNTLSTIVLTAVLSGAASAAGEEIRYANADGKVMLRLKAKDGGFKVLGPSGDAELGRIKAKEDRVKVKDPKDAEVLKIKKKESGCEIEDAAGTRLYRIKPKDGGWRMEDGAKNLVARVKAKDGGFEVLSNRDTLLATVRADAGRVVLRGPNGKTIGELTGTTHAAAAAWFALDSLTPLQRAALYAYFVKIPQ